MNQEIHFNNFEIRSFNKEEGTMDIKTFGVIGAGQMGNGIAQVAAMSGLDVVMNDIKTEFVERGLANITKILTRSVDKGKMSDDEKNTVLSQIKPSTDLQDMSKVDFVVEAATENESLKFQIFKNLDEISNFIFETIQDLDTERVKSTCAHPYVFEHLN